ncbi:MAG: S8 family serine peptidase [Rhodomicrobium sp.]
MRRFAAAKVSGVAASPLEKRPKAGPDEIRAALQSTATGVPGVDKSMTGFGLVNAKAAVAFVETSVPK